MLTLPYRFIVTVLGTLAIVLAALGQIGCAATEPVTMQTFALAPEPAQPSKFEQDRRAILGMAGEYDVSFNFEETLAVRPGYEIKEPYQSKASELVLVIEDTGGLISLQHLLVVQRKGETHIVKHWRQDWRFEAAQGYDFDGENTWLPTTYDEAQRKGAWVQSVYQVDDSPRYWGVAKWEHRDGVSTWSASTHRPLPRREHTKRDDYQVLGAVNTHVVTGTGWMHYQSNHKLDKAAKENRVIALESGVNRYVRTSGTDFSKAYDYWKSTSSYWRQVRAAWAEVYADGEPVRLANRWKGDKMYTHIFDLADEYWQAEDVSSARPRIESLIRAFTQGGDVQAQLD